MNDDYDNAKVDKAILEKLTKGRPQIVPGGGFRISDEPEHADFEALFDGTITVVTPLTDEAADWMKENVAFEPWQAVGKGVACDHRAADHLLAGILDEGFTVRKG